MSSPSLGQLELTVLLAVARLGDEAYGLAIRRDLAARTGRDYSVGAIYTTLERLESKGLVTSRIAAPQAKRGGRSRRQFKVNAAGHRAIRQAEQTAQSVWAGVGSFLNPETT
jgi:DNA-binding PadR family transcriptional regulator